MQITEVKNASRERVNHPSHYAAHYRREVIELTGHFDFTTGNALKYVLRCRFKEKPAEDLQKARWYLNYFADHPEAGFVREEGLDAVLADFRSDLLGEKSGSFGAEAARFMDPKDSRADDDRQGDVTGIDSDLSLRGIKFYHCCGSLVEDPLRGDHTQCKFLFSHERSSDYFTLARTSSMVPAFRK